MKVTLVDHTVDAVEKLGRYAAICYDRDPTDVAGNHRRVKHIIDVGHFSVLRFAHAVFHIEGISRVCLAQLTRSKHLDYLVRSSRYCDESEAEMYQPDSLVKAPPELRLEWARLEQASRDLYRNLRDAGMTKQDARFILPQSQETELYVVGNLQGWRDFLRLRLKPAAQAEVREVAERVKEELAGVAPEVFGGES